MVSLEQEKRISVCYAKATLVGRRFSEGGTHEETLLPQDLKEGTGEVDEQSTEW